MASKQEKPVEGEQPENENAIQSRVPLNRIIMDTPAMLKLIKHCQDCKDRAQVDGYYAPGQQSSDERGSKARGVIMGVLKKDLGDKMHDVFITQCQPQGSKGAIRDLRNLAEGDHETQLLLDTSNEIGFYVSCHLGLAFSHSNLIQLIRAYRNFRNSVMIVYDVNKSYYGLSPLQGFRLSEGAVDALLLNQVGQDTDQLIQERIRRNKIDVSNLFEQVDLKIHRSHLLQAFLFDHIQPHMPAFNTNIFRMTGTTQYMTQQLWSASDQSQKVIDEMTKMEADYKNTNKIAKKQNRNLQKQIVANKDKTTKGSIADKADEEALQSAKVPDSKLSLTDLFLFGKQIDQLHNSIDQFNSAFPQDLKTEMENFEASEGQ